MNEPPLDIQQLLNENEQLTARVRELETALTFALGALTNVSHNPDKPTIFDDGSCAACHAATVASAALAPTQRDT